MPRLPAVDTAGVRGSGPGGRIDITDIRSKLREISGDVEERAETARPAALTAGVAAMIVVVVLAFLLGRRRGQRKTTWVEIRRL